MNPTLHLILEGDSVMSYTVSSDPNMAAQLDRCMSAKFRRVSVPLGLCAMAPEMLALIEQVGNPDCEPVKSILTRAKATE